MYKKKLKYLIIGNRGQLGREFQRALMEAGCQYIPVDLKELDITNPDKVDEAFSYYKPDVTINCAAFNLVDKAEEETMQAMMVNGIAVKSLAIACKEHNSFLVHFSSDYVFDGEKSKPYVETDKTNPINEYGRTKLTGEQLIMEELREYLIFRLSWVYGKGNQNFIYKFNQWAEKNKELKITTDEISIPTNTKTIVKLTSEAIDRAMIGLYHMTASGQASRLEWAEAIADKLNLNVKILPAKQEDFNLPARRPRYSVLSNEKLSNELDVNIKEWDEDLDRYLNNDFSN